ncbi:MAG: flagella basal body P-ring formation protein FlgA [Planctomycetota bacterium]|nr:MAG: flagella basal body P-ring formation protein FlgA [Planctomycetota bacterium]REK26996.1 MAG: flagella basal body P-ring formation protein FlgA [Planctomycetota bacterium]REK47277.1 MAG: flagella basal body P-ring formation protein FlgA [Planctomycetota bacterium]
MSRLTRISSLTLAMVLPVMSVLLAGTAAGAEIRLLENVTVEPGIVRLGDVAELYAAPVAVTDRLAQIELFPAPTRRRGKVVRAREILDLLSAQGLNFLEHRVLGATHVTIVPAKKEVPKAEVVKPEPVRLTQQQIEAAQERVAQAVVQFVEHELVESAEAALAAPQSEADYGPWKAEVRLSHAQAVAIIQADERFTISGGQAPFMGRQRFEIAAVTPDNTVDRLSVDVQLDRPRLVVVALADLPRGTTIVASDVRLEEVSNSRSVAAAATSLAEVVGKETTTSLRAGKPVASRQLREPLLVKRGELVRVVAINGGVVIRTTALAKNDGSLNQLIPVETVPDPDERTRREAKVYHARVSGYQEVEVYAGSVARR